MAPQPDISIWAEGDGSDRRWFWVVSWEIGDPGSEDHRDESVAGGIEATRDTAWALAEAIASLAASRGRGVPVDPASVDLAAATIRAELGPA